jgi:hypothetical protein
MLRSIAVALAAFAVAVAFCAIAATAEESGDSTEVQVVPAKTLERGDLLKTRSLVENEHQQRAFRVAYWAAGLTGDKKTVYDTYGYPSYRSRQEQLGAVTETWTYLGADKSFTFRGDRLTKD